jgi:hypothetical protein
MFVVYDRSAAALIRSNSLPLMLACHVTARTCLSIPKRQVLSYHPT